MITKQRIEKCIEDLKKEKLVQKYLYSYTWLSGSSTNVYPIKVWKESIVHKPFPLIRIIQNMKPI